jgi:hypothetical protein
MFPLLDRYAQAGPHGLKAISFDPVAPYPGSNTSKEIVWKARNNHTSSNGVLGGNVLRGEGSAAWSAIEDFDQPGYTGSGTYTPANKYYTYRGSTTWNSNWQWWGPDGSGSWKSYESSSVPDMWY